MTYYSITKHGAIIASSKDAYEHNGVTYEPACVGYMRGDNTPLVNIMDEMANVSSGYCIEDNEIIAEYSNVIWLQDMVIYEFIFKSSKDKVSDKYYIQYPHTLISRCSCCGSPCSFNPSFCNQCLQIALDISAEEKEKLKVSKEISELNGIIRNLEERVNERYRRHQNKASWPVAKVRQRRAGRSGGQNTHRLRTSNS